MKIKIGFTGERLVNKKNNLYKAHMALYKFACKFAKNRKILDYSCGNGYGSYYLSKYANEVVGIDIDENTIDYCRKKYSKDNLSFAKISPKETTKDLRKKFDYIVSIETIEHIKDVLFFLRALKTYLKKNGIIFLTTPNNYQKIYPPKNKFHIYEYDIIELYLKLRKFFPQAQIDIYGFNKTNIRRRDKTIKIPLIRRFIKYIFDRIYHLDLEYFHLLRYIENTMIYKKIGNLQNTYKRNFTIYKINPRSNFYNPTNSIFIIRT